MSDNRARPRIHRTDDKHDRDLRAYADKHGIEPWRALADAIQRLAWTDGPTIDTLRADLESAREATRRADAEVERLTRELAEVRDAARAEVDRVNDAYTAALRLADKREAEAANLRLAEGGRLAQLDMANAEIARLGGALQTERAAWCEASGAESPTHLAAALAAKGATDRLAERVETIAADVDRRACACALPDDLAPRLAAIAARRDVAPDVMLANVIKNGISKIQASDEYQDRQKAARKARS